MDMLLIRRLFQTSTHAWNVKNLAAGTYYLRIEEERKNYHIEIY
jgi:hypothetical protein